jgi:Protein of unknown function (DUF1573)
MVPRSGAPSLIRSRLWLVACFVVCAALGGYWVFSVVHSRSTRAQLVSVRADKLDFGDVWADENFVWTVPITNDGLEAITLREFFSSCACMGIQPKTLEIPAGGTGTIQLALNLTHGKPEAGKASRPFSVRVTASIGAKSTRKITWTISGRVRKVFEMVPSLLSFKEGSLVRGEVFPSQKVELHAHTEVTGVSAECRPPLATVAVVAGEAKNTFAVAVTPKRDLPAGELRFDVLVHGLTAHGALPVALLPVYGRVLEQVEFTPPTLLFGHRALGEQAEETVLVRSRSGKTFKVLTFEATSKSIEVERLAASSDSLPQFRVRQKFLELGQQSAVVSFRVLVDGRSVTVALPARYCGLARKVEER